MMAARRPASYPALAAPDRSTPAGGRSWRSTPRGQKRAEALEQVIEELEPTTSDRLPARKLQRQFAAPDISSTQADVPAPQEAAPAQEIDESDCIQGSEQAGDAADVPISPANSTPSVQLSKLLTPKAVLERCLHVCASMDGDPLSCCADGDQSDQPSVASSVTNGLTLLINDAVDTAIRDHPSLLPKERALREKMLGLMAGDMTHRPLPDMAYTAAAGKKLQTRGVAVAKRERELLKMANDKARAGEKASSKLEPQAATEKLLTTSVAATVDYLVDITEFRGIEYSPWPKPKSLKLAPAAPSPAPVPVVVPTPAPSASRSLVPHVSPPDEGAEDADEYDVGYKAGYAAAEADAEFQASLDALKPMQLRPDLYSQ